MHLQQSAEIEFSKIEKAMMEPQDAEVEAPSEHCFLEKVYI